MRLFWFNKDGSFDDNYYKILMALPQTASRSMHLNMLKKTIEYNFQRRFI
jgi:hypothetical protein